MKRNPGFLFAVICTAVLAQGASAEPAAEPQYVDGAALAQQIEGKLQADGFSPITKINVEAQDGGIVTLKGIAASDAEAARAVAIANDVSGVMTVKSEILIKRVE